MREYDLKKLIDNFDLVDERIKEFFENKTLFKQDIDKEEIEGHILKSRHNLRFVAETINSNFLIGQ